MTATIRGFFGGSGLGVFSDHSAITRLLAMVPSKDTATVAYIGTASYDLPKPMQEQTNELRARGCRVVPILVADPKKKALTSDEELFLTERADIVLVSGGNTLYAIRRWEETGLTDTLRRVAAAGRAVLAGGSAGAICWFTSGHSDSADPTTYAEPMIKQALRDAEGDTSPAAPVEGADSWQYIRVHGLGVLPGMVCPHFDVTQSNGVRREQDFVGMLRRHPNERGIGIDHWAVLILQGDGTYEVFEVPDKQRALSPPGAPSAAEGNGAPSVFVLDVKDRQLSCHRVPPRGKVSEILREPTGPLVPDPFERFFAMANPSASSGALLRR